MTIQVTIKPNQTAITVEAKQTTVAVDGRLDTAIEVGKQGPAGPPGPGGGEAQFHSAEVDSSVTPGQPLYLKGNGHTDLAQANQVGTARVCGVAAVSASATTSVSYTSDGVIELTDWSLVTGSPSLTPGLPYWLSPDLPGCLTATAPAAIGQLVVQVGRALTTQRLDIEIQPSILL